jgi:HEAT repeat protein
LLGSEQDSEAARSALRDIDRAELDALPVLIAALDSEDRRARFYAAFFLRKLGPAAKEALPSLRRYADDENSRFRESVQEAIESIEGTNSRKGTRSSLKVQNPNLADSDEFLTGRQRSQ